MTRPSLRPVLFLAVVLGGCGLARAEAPAAMTFAVRHIEGRPALVARGEIRPDSAEVFGIALARSGLGARPRVVIESPGGHLGGALALGRAFRRLGAETTVAAPLADGRLDAAACNSACVYAFAGGTERQLAPGSTLGLHQAFLASPADAARNPRQHYSADEMGAMQRTMAGLAAYLAEMGVHPEALARAAATPPHALHRLKRDEAAELGLSTRRVARVDVPTPKQPPSPRIETPPDPRPWPMIERAGRPWLVMTAEGPGRRFGITSAEVAIGCAPAADGFVATFREDAAGAAPTRDTRVILAPGPRAVPLAAGPLAGELRGTISRDTALGAARQGTLDVEVTSSITAGYPLRLSAPGQGLPEALDRLDSACRR